MSQNDTTLYPTPPEQHETRIAKLESLLMSQDLPLNGLPGIETHLEQIKNAVPKQSEPTYLGFVIGGVTPAANLADNIVTELDANVHAHLPDVSITTTVEDTALKWLLQLYNLNPNSWTHRIVTTGATASNILGLACGRDFVVRESGKKLGLDNLTIAEFGFLEVFKRLSLDGIRVLTSMPHSSLRKGASIVGLGRNSVVDLTDPTMPPRLDLALLEQELSNQRFLHIVAISCGEVNTGRFATDGETMQRIRALCDLHGAWLHVDGAFGLQARILEKAEYPTLAERVRNIELADSIAGDGHKMLNVPYDCGFFFSKHVDVAVEVFQNTGAAYLSRPQIGPIMSPLHIGLENSRRFRALPLYASLWSLGRTGYVDILKRQISTARKIADWIHNNGEYELLPMADFYSHENLTKSVDNILEDIYMVVMFRARNADFNKRLLELMNASKQVYVSGTQWDQLPAVRVAVANWKVDPERESKTVIEVLNGIWNQWNDDSQ